MPASGMTFDNSGCDAAQDLLGLQSSLQGTDCENSNLKKTVKAAKFNCQYFITSAAPQLTGPVAAINRAPKKYLLHRYNANTAVNRDVASVATQTENESSLIKEMELAISQRDETIKQLREQIEAREHVTGTAGEEVHDETTKEDSREMKVDDSSDSSDPDSDETHTGADDVVSIGKGKTMIPRKIFENINWDSYRSATRKLSSTVFSRSVLATHSLTGRPSPAFPDRTPKKKLNETLVNDIVKIVAKRSCVAENLVRACITTKCADESKMSRMRKNRVHKENIAPESDSD